MKKIIIIVLILVVLMFLFNVRDYTGNVIPRWLMDDFTPEWEKYYLDEEANQDKLYCRTVEDEYGNVLETRWHSYFTNRGELIRTDKGDTRTPNCADPNFVPVYAKGSNEGKEYSRVVRDGEGNVIETLWHSACTNKVIRVDEGDTTYPGSNSFMDKCYHPGYITNEKVGEFEEEEEETLVESYVSMGEKLASWFKNLFGI